jgi:hypothetical protein
MSKYTVIITKSGPTINQANLPINNNDEVTWKITGISNERLVIEPNHDSSLFTLSNTGDDTVVGTVSDGKTGGSDSVTVGYSVILENKTTHKREVLFSSSRFTDSDPEPYLVIDKLGDPPTEGHPHPRRPPHPRPDCDSD